MPDAAVVWGPATPLHKKGALGLNSFSTPPTIAEINASSDWYQVAALYNRRASQIYDSPTYFTLAYSSGVQNTPTAASINDLRAKINAMRVDTGLSAYTFGSDRATGNAIKALHLTDLRTALAAVPSVAVYAPAVGYRYARIERPTGTVIRTETGSLSPVSAIIGVQDGFDIGPGGIHLIYLAFRRMGASFLFPTFQSALKSTAVANLRIATSSPNNSPTVDLYTSNSDDSAGPSGWWDNEDNFIDSVSPASGSHNYDLNFAMSDINAATGAYLSCVFVESNEYGGSTTVRYVTLSPTIRVDFGF